VFGLSGGLAAVRARLDLFGVLVLAAVVGLAGGVTRDLLIGVAPETFRDGRYLVAAGAAGVVCFFSSRGVERLHRGVLFFDAIGLSLFAVTGATKAVAAGMGSAQAVLLGAITGIGGGMLRDVLLREVPVVLRADLYAIPALAGAAVVAIAHEVGSDAGVYAVAGAALCLVLRIIGMRYGVTPPAPRSAKRHDDQDDSGGVAP